MYTKGQGVWVWLNSTLINKLNMTFLITSLSNFALSFVREPHVSYILPRAPHYLALFMPPDLLPISSFQIIPTKIHATQRKQCNEGHPSQLHP